MKVWTRAEQFDGTKGRLRAWLLVMVRNLAMDYFRFARSRFSRDCSIDTLDHCTDNDMELKFHRSHLIAGGLRNLPPHEKRVLELGYFYGYTQTEIARIMDAPLGTVKSWTRSALLRLREELLPALTEEGQAPQSTLASLPRPLLAAFEAVIPL